MISLVAPEEHRVVRDLLQHHRVDAVRVRQDRFEQVLLAQTIRGILVVGDRSDGDGRPVKPVRVHLLGLRETVEAVRGQLDNAGTAHPRDQARLLRLRIVRRGSGRRANRTNTSKAQYRDRQKYSSQRESSVDLRTVCD